MKLPSGREVKVRESQAEYCSFCGKERGEVFYIVEGPANIGICDECIPLAADVVAEQRARSSTDRAQDSES